MVKSVQTSETELPSGVKAPVQETLLTPRFYTTDFEAMAQTDVSAQNLELQAIVEELRADYNRHHFVRDRSSEECWDSIDGETRLSFIDFLERSCTSEFSGFLLFKELSRRLKNQSPILAEAFQYMARDEARHAGFLNKAMADFNLSLDLGSLTKNRTYTFFPPEWIIYAVYLSEKIGYWRYIIMYRHIESNPEHQMRVGVRMRTDMETSSKHSCDRNPKCGTTGKRVCGYVSFSWRCLLPTLSLYLKGQRFINQLA